MSSTLFLMHTILARRMMQSGGTDPTPSDGYVSFQDSAAEALALAAWDTDGDGRLSYAEAKAITSLGSAFKGQTIASLTDETKHMSVQALAADELRSTNVTGDLTLHGLRRIEGTGAPTWDLQVGGTLSLPDLETVTATNAWHMMKCGCLDIGASAASLGGLYHTIFNAKIIIRAPAPPTLTGITVMTPYIYVPDASLEAYKAADVWSTVASRIFALSEIEG